MATMKRCLAQLSLSGSWGTEHLWPDLEVDLDRELAPGFTVADAVRGREDCFEDVYITAASDAPVPAGFKTTLVDPGTDFSKAVLTPIDSPASSAASEPHQE